MALNAICPYFTMFPLSFPYSVLKDHASPGDRVLDPFCGRGTTNYAARLCGLPSLGIDSNPVATAIAEAKLVNVSPERIVAEAEAVLEEVAEPQAVPAGDFWSLAFHPHVLATICRLREGLMTDCTSEVRTALRAILLGALHGPWRRSGTSYFSNQCPRTYAPKPRYAVGFWKSRGLVPPRVDALDIIRARAHRYYGHEGTVGTGRIIHADSRQAETWTGAAVGGRARWVITSPPYYGMRTYGPDQWLRMWFLGGPPEVSYPTPGQLVHTSPAAFADDLRRVWRHTAAASTPDARLIIRFGGINDRKADPLSILVESLQETPWEVSHIQSAGFASAGRRQSLAFLGAANPAREEYDVWARRASSSDATPLRPLHLDTG